VFPVYFLSIQTSHGKISSTRKKSVYFVQKCFANNLILAEELLYPLALMFNAPSPEEFVSESKDVTLGHLKQITGHKDVDGRVGKICGRVFKSGEPTYTCK
jgi:hypothetical protein